MARFLSITLLVVLIATVSACKGGSKGSSAQVDAINVNPAAPTAGSLVQLTGDISGSGAGAATKNWSVSAGSLSLDPPDFALILRGTAKAGSAASLNTTRDTIYWLAPASGASATITLAVGGSTKTRNITLGASPVTLNVADSGSNKVVTVNAANVSDLYQAAFRVTYTSAWEPVSAVQGDFLGAAADTLFLEMHDQSGFVPVAITRKGNASGVDGSGTLATITFKPASGTSSVRAASAEPFDIGLVVLRNSQDEAIQF